MRKEKEGGKEATRGKRGRKRLDEFVCASTTRCGIVMSPLSLGKKTRVASVFLDTLHSPHLRRRRLKEKG
jgi:hypothetical protein